MNILLFALGKIIAEMNLWGVLFLLTIILPVSITHRKPDFKDISTQMILPYSFWLFPFNPNLLATTRQ